MYKKYIKQFTKIRDFDNLIKFIILILQDKKIRFLILYVLIIGLSLFLNSIESKISIICFIRKISNRN